MKDRKGPRERRPFRDGSYEKLGLLAVPFVASNEKRKRAMIEPLIPDARYNPCPVTYGDEVFPNGIFEFNVTRMLEYIDNHPADVPPVEVAVSDLDRGFSSLDESYVQSVDISRPVVLAEISPGRYNLIDGHHRVAKAARQGLKTIRAYKLTVRQHLQFLTSRNAYLKYIEYWNDKLELCRVN